MEQITGIIKTLGDGIQAVLDLFKSFTDAGSASAESIGGIKDALIGMYDFITGLFAKE
ncbi:MAG: hypothetical protein IKN72_11740 [Clostridia bacterium]|nr:hypothetical protein [Clostridia bacterium]MBR3554039.1 hypothetical protein [Clostridia bacterium]